jgi:DNA-binding response OmpR family regulator
MPHKPVLVVDDSALARVTIASRLAEDGVASTTAGSFFEASRTDARGFAAALLDLELGDGSGRDLALLLRGQAPALPIAFFTASSHGRDLEAARALGPVFTKDDLDAAATWILSTVS